MLVGNLKVIILVSTLRKNSLVEKNTDKHEVSFLDLNIKIKNGKFHFGLFDKRDSFLFSIVRMPDKSSNVPCSIVYSAIGAKSLRISRASKPLIALMSRQVLYIEKISSSILKRFNKHHSDFNVCQSK